MKTIGTRANPVDLMKLDDGSSPLVVALPNEYVSEVFDRVRELGGNANIAIAFAKDFQVMTLSDRAVSHGELEVNHDLSMGMLLIKMSKNPGKTIRISVRESAVALPQIETKMQYA
ncbi:hypothetical protein J2X60_000968 [Curtobacterium sp. 320]|uniref:hypothetical protein n=1 Tax=Curtobacterium sp. 320 TaxID=2817749 RepID=UPI0028560669|nr:hypothetical protein [Curtobacterium sp. 320]MDR6572332.1 hypothetical protein [Curtobacterium sp. 320]